jgi:2-(1,2-epoxy-1,2-dihydrophenyl)acetyl-CoA isomerase
MAYENLTCERNGAVLTVRLNRPAKMNSLSRGLLLDLRECAEGLAADKAVHAVLLTGSGRGFCAGADLTDPDGAPAPGESLGQWVSARLRNHFHPVAELWSRLPVPLVVAVNGIAAGAGVSLALLGDVTIAARSAAFAVLFTPKLGLAPDMGATYLLPRRIGHARARYLALTGRPVDAEEAERIGLIAECVDDAALESRAAALAAELAAGPTRAQLALRDLIDDGAFRTLADQLEREALAQQSLADTRDFLEGITAFREKRAPRFQGA